MSHPTTIIDDHIEGMLWKFSTCKGRVFGGKNWKERFFICDGASVRYYEKKGQSKPKGSVPINSITYVHPFVGPDIHECATVADFSYFALRFTENKKEYMLLLRAPSDEDRESWVAFLSTKLAPHIGEALMAQILDDEDNEEEPSPMRRTRDPSQQGSPTSDGAPTERMRSGTVKGAVRGMVSKKKQRFQQDCFDLDLSYITPRLIAMGYPSQGKESFYRNSQEDVDRFLSFYHKDNFRIYNLCSERKYPPETFSGAFEHFPFDDHNPPPLTIYQPFSESVHAYLESHHTRVAAVHCKAGKGRTGTMVCAYLLYSKQFNDADEVLKFFGERRTHDGKGVTIPSQIRYVHYFAHMARNNNLPPPEQRITLDGVTLHGTPRFDVDGGSDPYFLCWVRDSSGKEGVDSLKKVFDSRDHLTVQHYIKQPLIELKFPRPPHLRGDVKFCFFDADTFVDDAMFQFWINTDFLPLDGLTLTKSELDGAVKDKLHKAFDEDFKVSLKYTIQDGKKVVL